MKKRKYKCYCKSCREYCISALTSNVYRNGEVVGKVGKCPICGGGAAIAERITNDS
jgi:hypothetical protein